MTTGRIIVDAFLAGDPEAVARHLAPDAILHSPVTDYHGAERVTEILTAAARVIEDAAPTRVLAGPNETAAFFTATAGERRADGVLLVVAPPGGAAGELTLMLRPLKPLLAGIERMRELVAA